LRSIARALGNSSPQLRLFLAGVFMIGIAGGIFETTFNNFLSDTFDVGADTRGFLEFPRELPGFLTALFAGMLFFLPETLIAAFCALAIGAGMIGLAVWGVSWSWMLTFMILWSAGAHLLMPIRSSVSMHLAHAEHRGRRLGQVNAAGIAATLCGCGLVWVAMKHFEVDYAVTFTVGGVAAICGAVAFFVMRLPEAHLERPKFVWNRKYWLYYVLAFLFGARKQIFLTFGPWVLIRVFRQPAYVIAQLWLASAVVGVFFQPWLGRLIDRIGERKVLVADSVAVFVVCMGYGFAHRLGSETAALWLLYVCYVGDHLLFGVNMARTTYISKIAVRREDVAPTLSLGITINHAVSMSMPALGGLAWVHFGHPSVFLFAAAIAVVMLVFSARIET